MAKFVIESSKASTTNPGVFSNAVRVLPSGAPSFVVGTKAWIRTNSEQPVGSSFDIPDGQFKLVTESNENGAFNRVQLGQF